LSNIDAYSGNTVTVQTAAVGDSNGNVYVGVDAGNPYTTTKLCSNVSAFGYSAASGISNVSNSVFIGFNAGNGASSVSSNVIIGAATTGNGSSNVRIGSSNTGTGSSNVSIGASTTGATFSNCILLGPGITATQNNQFKVGTSYLTGNMSNKWLGLNTTTSMYSDPTSSFDISGNTTIKGYLGVNKAPTRTVDINGDFRANDGNGNIVDFNDGNFTVSNASGLIKLSNDGVTYISNILYRYINTATVAQPVIQYGSNTSGSGAFGNLDITLPTSYTSSNYVIQVTMGSSVPAEMSAVNTASNYFTVYWSNAAVGTHTIFWTTFG
jgi:hypothetical protein